MKVVRAAERVAAIRAKGLNQLAGTGEEEHKHLLFDKMGYQSKCRYN
jgi:hypothetical protein